MENFTTQRKVMEEPSGTKRKELAGMTASLKIKTDMEIIITVLKKETGGIWHNSNEST